MDTGNKKILAFGAHPDDVEFMCAGTLKLLKDKGYEIHIAMLSGGDVGSAVETQAEIIRTRRQESIDAASLLDAAIYPLGELDLQIEFDDRTKRKVTEIVRAVDPFIVFTHAHEDYVMDHEIASRLVRHGCFSASIPNYFTEAVFPQPVTSHAPYLYYWSPLEGRNIYGDFVSQRIYVDITTTIEFKAQMLARHKSQRDWMSELGMDRYIDGMRNTAKLYGEASGFGHAEGFIQHVGTVHPKDNVLSGILGSYLKENK